MTLQETLRQFKAGVVKRMEPGEIVANLQEMGGPENIPG